MHVYYIIYFVLYLGQACACRKINADIEGVGDEPDMQPNKGEATQNGMCTSSIAWKVGHTVLTFFPTPVALVANFRFGY